MSQDPCNAFGRHLREAAAVALQPRLFAGELLPAGNGNVDVDRIKLDGMAATPGHLGGDDGCSRSAEWLIHRLAWRRVVLDRSAHAVDRLLRAVAGCRLAVWDLPDRGLLAITAPVTLAALSNRVPGWLVLPVIVATPDHQPGFVMVSHRVV